MAKKSASIYWDEDSQKFEKQKLTLRPVIEIEGFIPSQFSNLFIVTLKEALWSGVSEHCDKYFFDDNNSDK